ncbi:M15 family metallopeptidase [Mesorhizobium sp.]|uniref:M15 family metallopeptidase n=1 Tax=Mesorhizobium sp. TaxID=1871066 RepID=UPI000FE9AFE9|nr:M15 family metallopeptidase [Mesorhizobium sp.]RWF66841.1 MAG: hypothetical protein EOS47_04440 [Mesorhizobium sp.]
MTVQLNSLRVSAQLDASQYAAGAAQKVAADQSMTSSAQGVGQAVAQTQQKISQSGDVLARLSRQYVDGYAAAQRFQIGLEQLSRGLDTGRISVQQMGPILDGMYRKFNMAGDASIFFAKGQNEAAAAVLNLNAKLAQQQQRMPAANSNARLSGGQLQGLGYQANDIATMALLGASPGQIAFSQGGQILQTLQMGEGGIAGSLNAIKGSAAAAGTALVGMLGTTGLIATGFGAAAVAAGAFYLATREKAKELNDILSQQKDIIQSLGPAYQELARIGQSGPFESAGVARLALQSNLEDARKTMQEQVQAALKQTSGSGGTFLSLIGALPEGVQSALGRSQSSIEFERIMDSASRGETSINDARAALVKFGQEHPDFSYIIGRFISMTSTAAATERQVKSLENTLGGLGNPARSSVGNFERTQQAGRDQSVMSQRFGDDPFAAQREQQRQKENQLAEAQDQRRRSLDQTIASARLDVELIGKTTSEVEALRMAFQLEQQVREEAARNNTKVDEAEIARIKEKAAEYGRLRALQEARDTIKSQQDDLEAQRAEAATVGENALARQRSADALKTEQQIRKLGIPLYGQEAEAMRANTAALSDQAEALAHATMQSDLLFQRRQILRNSDDQQIASALRSAGLPEDLNSMEAQMMRYNIALQETKDTFKGFFSDMFSGLREGKSLWESFKDAAVSALGKIADKLIDRGLDGIFNSIFGGPQAGSSQGLLGQLFNFGGAANDNSQQPTGGAGSLASSLFGAGGRSVGTMQVQAATVFVNGGVGGIPGLGGGLGDILSKLASPSFTADTTLSDILGYGGISGPNTAATAAKLLSGLGSPLGAAANDNGVGSVLSQVFASAGVTKTGIPLSQIGIGGFTAKVASDYAGRFQGLLNDLKAAGYPITSLGEGGYSFRNVAGTNNLSRHAFGEALDINPRQNPYAYGSQGDFAKYGIDPSALAEKNGLIWGGNWRKPDTMHFQVNRDVDMGATSSISKLGDAAKAATSGIETISTAGMQVSKSLIDASGGLTNFGSMLSSFMSSPTGGGSSWFQGLSGLFGGTGGALNFMNSISPAATSDILSGSWGLFDVGGFTGSGGRNQPAGIVHRGEIVWSQDDIRRAGGVHVVEGMRAGLRGYDSGGYADRIRMRSSHNDSFGVSADGNRGRGSANDDRRQTVNQTNNFIFRENPATPASQNQIAAKTARSVEKVNRTA